MSKSTHIDEIFRAETQESSDLTPSGTSRQGTLKSTSRNEITRHFGEPDGPYSKIGDIWIIRFGGGTKATIYDYRKSNLHAGDDEPVDWSIGGRSEEAVKMLDILGFDVKGYDVAVVA